MSPSLLIPNDVKASRPTVISHTFFSQIPPAIWTLAGGVLGIVGTLAASVIANMGNNARLERQIKQESKQKHLDRITQARRAVYLEAADEMVDMSSFIGSLASVDATNQEALSSAFLGFQKACAKIALVCEEVTRKRLVSLSGQYGRLFMELMIDARQAHTLKVDINVNRQMYEQLGSERQRIVVAMREASESVAPKHVFEALTSSFDLVSKQLDENAAEFHALTTAYNAALPVYAKAASEKISKVVPLQAEIVGRLREELGLEADLEGMRREYEEQAALAKQAGEKFFDDFSRSDMN
jgi:hypothetical protein